ncbi:hypothetical protein BJV78DRAFT_1223451 [Lactifluus subvellereus]|nr:hypothetical protein BJV78DRAFT_1223451 [Lactifluus subvellereus]
MSDFFVPLCLALPAPLRSFRLHPSPSCNMLFCGAKRAADGEVRSGGMGAPLIIRALPRFESKPAYFSQDGHRTPDPSLTLVISLSSVCAQDFTWKELPKVPRSASRYRYLVGSPNSTGYSSDKAQFGSTPIRMLMSWFRKITIFS